jgi:hypothetical protein
MSMPHQLGVRGASLSEIEAIHPSFFKESLFAAREKTIQLFSEIKSSLKEGMNEEDARKLANNIAHDLCATKHWHQPYIRFGKGTTLSFHEPLNASNLLLPNTPVSIDLGPVWFDSKTALEYEGDYGDSFVFGEHREAQVCIETARQLFKEGKQKWASGKLSGFQLYQFIKDRCEELGYQLASDFDGHRLSDFPHQQYTKERLAHLPFVPSEDCWVFELQINDLEGRFGAFYEDLL